MQDLIARALKQNQRTVEDFVSENSSNLIRCAEFVCNAFRNSRKLMLCGNGGSAADAQHIAAEFVNRFQIDRSPLPALALTTDTSIITSVANDNSFEDIFSRQIEALGAGGDVLLAISTSGRSRNILSAIDTAKRRGIYTIGLMGEGGGEMLRLVDLALVVKSNQTPRVQEAHILAGHIICELAEHMLFQGKGA
ncbi:MAG TPA: SIS domain-containing protein [Desulfatiglandales bacterium]|nr:SIS domain-containing protein [Desulfatiglandales bacterium]